MLPLAEAFKRWQRGELDSYALQDMIHSFDRGPAREIYSRYDRRTGYQDAHVARAGTASVHPFPPNVGTCKSGS